MCWEFDAKDQNWEKYGNFNSPTLMKLISKYNKTIGSDQIQADPNAISEIFVQELNDILKKTDCGEHCGSVFAEI